MYLYIWLCVIVGALWLYQRKKHSYFKKHEINHLPPVPFLGHLARPLFKLENAVENMKRIYFAFPEDRFVGMYDFTLATVMIRDPELLRLIGVKDFDYFTDHRSFGNDNDAFFSKSLIGLKGQKWRDMRSTLSPAFTGSKLRGMVPFIQECSKDLTEYLNSEVKKNKNGYLDVDARDLFTRYTNDVIATCAFGLKVNSIVEKDNEFYKRGYELTNIKFRNFLKMLIVISFPILNKFIDMSLISEKSMGYLKQIVLTTMRNRDEKNIFRPDLIQILLEAKKGTLQHENIQDQKDAGFATVEESSVGKSAIKRAWDDEHLVAQAILFFFAGFDTVSTALMFLLYELAVNPDIQTKLRQEIDESYEKYQGNVDYDKLNQMKYMDMVLSESLRKWTAPPSTDRICLKSYNMGKPNKNAKKDFWLEKGTVVVVPTWAIHHDPKYFPEPQSFDPERFSDENKHKIKPFTYMPFGLGPRNCIGSRFAITEVKSLVFDLLRNFELSPGPKTRVPAELDPSNLTIRLLGGHWLRIIPRDGIVSA